MDTVKHIIKTPNQEVKIQISKISHIKKCNKDFIYFDKLKDGTWRMCYTNEMLKDIGKTV